MKIQDLKKSTLLLKIAFVVSLAVILFTASVSYKHIINLNKSRDLVIHSYEVQLELERVISYIKDAETGYRGYLLYGDTTFLDSYSNSREKVNKAFFNLKNLTADNQSQQKKLKELYHLIVLRYTYFNKSYEDKDLYKKYYEANGKKVMDQIRKKVDEMVSLENSILKKREFDFRDSVSYTPLYALLVIFITLFFIVIAYIKINSDFKKIERSNSRLRVSQESINQAEILGNYCSWTWNLEKDEIQFSDNQFRLFGLEPQVFEATHTDFLGFVHPDDYEVTSKAINDIPVNESLPTINYRIINKNEEVRHLRSVGKLFINRFNEKIIIGTTRDVTEDIVKKIILREKNTDLERNNKELVEFNYAASHDLQEPLRKIQTFISRINEKEKENLSDTGKEYLERIVVSASRMRVLIDDLLQYSRTNKTDASFEEVDLDETATAAVQELSQLIEETNATVDFCKLPTIKGIPFQLRQLFINLINNSIKYKKPDQPPIITISYEKIKASDDDQIDDNSNRMYHKISFVDNGIGFHPDDSKKIFLLFNRLHAKDSYPGTGVGLAICKKIVKNHYGFICANGQPDEGALITVYLPTEY
ncbi:CHASE3 domain-containing protein [Flavobacterium azooxidireducens]|uniref:histidine kinase n=1 Tax=Flavobacterium azooxidireducens TaxID=1871076 RepID=A0ABY4KJN3_9FLAO|nr:CHASE3 domain-containing protein [Flavobacterium azooxidireducens]UPQ79615.1 CHASE3 domain-containing protein [Flavobacterium azooxidireducens]